MEVEESGNYRYLGIQELDTIRHETVKQKVSTNFKARLRKLLESELNARNLFQAINECVLPIITYLFGIVNWREKELKDYDIKIRKMLNMCRVFELKSDVDRLYLPRQKGGRGLMSVWDTFQASTLRIRPVI